MKEKKTVWNNNLNSCEGTFHIQRYIQLHETTGNDWKRKQKKVRNKWKKH